MGQITVLDQNMVNMIAAGEVIERPASVVKELVENSIDAGATKITVTIEDGGRKLISVADDGCGMGPEDLATAFEPHTTSKIKTSKDLRGISTLGFRGEALASIASVAQVRAVSRMKAETGANSIEIDCGSKGSVSPASADYGTTMTFFINYLPDANSLKQPTPKWAISPSTSLGPRWQIATWI
jgi:DNA mismatch repair protein MutL